MSSVHIHSIDDNSETKFNLWLCFHSLLSSFSITGEKRVKRENLSEEDFTLPDEHRVAKYNPKNVARYWNRRNASRSFFKTVASSFLNGIHIKLLPVTIIYISLYYVLNIFLVQKLLCPEGISHTLSATYLEGASNNTTCNKEMFEQWGEMEKDFTRVLTFFIGFFVSMSINNWSTQVRLVPHLDQIIIGLETSLWIDPTKSTDEVKIKGNTTAKELRMTILRYYLLSWTMCLSRVSSRLKNRFQDEYAFNRKRLLDKREFDELNCRTGSDSWIEKWTIPLLWINKMVNDIDLKGSTDAKIKDIKDGVGKPLTAFCQDLEKLSSYNEYRMPSSLIKILTMAIYLFMIIALLSGQYDIDMVADSFPNQSNIIIMILDFPFFALFKYLMLFGWLKLATDLSSPFGEGR